MNPNAFILNKIKINIEDDFFIDGYNERKLYDNNFLELKINENELNKSISCISIGCNKLFTNLTELENHYNAIHRNICSYCKKSFLSTKILNIHILETHDKLFKTISLKKPMYECFVDGCSKVFMKYSDRKNHLIGFHHYPKDFNLLKRNKICKFYNTKNGCKNEKNCKFIHKKIKNDMEIDDLCNKFDNLNIPKKISFGRKHVKGFSTHF